MSAAEAPPHRDLGLRDHPLGEMALQIGSRPNFRSSPMKHLQHATLRNRLDGRVRAAHLAVPAAVFHVDAQTNQDRRRWRALRSGETADWSPAGRPRTSNRDSGRNACFGVVQQTSISASITRLVSNGGVAGFDGASAADMGAPAADQHSIIE